MVIFKYILDVIDKQKISLPIGAKLLSVQVQHEIICLWAAIDINAEFEDIEIAIAGTGHDAPEGEYVGTVQLTGGALVLHIFKVPNA